MKVTRAQLRAFTWPVSPVFVNFNKNTTLSVVYLQLN